MGKKYKLTKTELFGLVSNHEIEIADLEKVVEHKNEIIRENEKCIAKQNDEIESLKSDRGLLFQKLGQYEFEKSKPE